MSAFDIKTSCTAQKIKFWIESLIEKSFILCVCNRYSPSPKVWSLRLIKTCTDIGFGELQRFSKACKIEDKQTKRKSKEPWPIIFWIMSTSRNIYKTKTNSVFATVLMSVEHFAKSAKILATIDSPKLSNFLSICCCLRKHGVLDKSRKNTWNTQNRESIFFDTENEEKYREWYKVALSWDTKSNKIYFSFVFKNRKKVQVVEVDQIIQKKIVKFQFCQSFQKSCQIW